uniref:G-protein coupled receptors family 2 profile 2 domain-containing protein n=1 Tax=Astyanax mexicanus TaxID=7994 RepID=A0A3B1ISN3_ASTMX
MSPLNEDSLSLTIITYVGLSVSVLSLVVFLLIEIIFWKPLTSSQTNSPMLYLRHVSMVNIALSLLIADIWLIAGVTDKLETNPACHAVIFFIHFFYLAVFFWMLVSAILLLYSVIVVFTNMSKTSLMAISFSVGYGAPLIIAVITVASTAGRGKYIRKDACWLQWDDSRALLAFAFPVLAIVFTNFVVMIVVLYKMLKKRVGERTSDEKNSMAVIARFVAVLTPILGLTWGFGLGTITSPGTVELHYLFAILNSLQVNNLTYLTNNIMHYWAVSQTGDNLIFPFNGKSTSSAHTPSCPPTRFSCMKLKLQPIHVQTFRVIKTDR